jgi:hypothetical protein
MSIRTKSFHSFKYILIFSSFLSFFCGRETAPGIDEEKFIEVYANYLVLDELKVSDSLRIRYQAKLLADNKMTEEELRESIAYYRDDPERWVALLERLRDHIKELKNTPLPDSLELSE